MAKPKPYDPKLGDEICDRLVDGESLRSITRDDHMPNASTVFKWLNENEVFAKQYAHAREAQADTLADEILDIADDKTNDTEMVRSKDGEELYEKANTEWINRSRLRVDSRKWIASKLKPKKYGDKLDVTSNNEKIGLAAELDAAVKREEERLRREGK